MRTWWCPLLLVLSAVPAVDAQPKPPSFECSSFWWQALVHEPFEIVPDETFYSAQLIYNATVTTTGGCGAQPCYGAPTDVEFRIEGVPKWARVDLRPARAQLSAPNETGVRQAVSSLTIGITKEAPPQSLTLYRASAWGCGLPRLGDERWIINGGEPVLEPQPIPSPAARSPGFGLWALAGVALVVAVRRYWIR